MKNYNVNHSSDVMNDTGNSDGIAAQYKDRKNGVGARKANELETESDIELDDIELEDISMPTDEVDASDVLLDSSGQEAKIEKPMWKSNEKRNKKKDAKKKNDVSELEDMTPAWQKPPSRMSTGAWFITLLLLLIPGINIILLFYWSFFSDSVSEEKKNFSRAHIIITAILLILCITFATIGLSAFKHVMSIGDIKGNMSDYTTDIKNSAKDSIKDAISSGKDEYKDLSDDDFTN